MIDRDHALCVTKQAELVKPVPPSLEVEKPLLLGIYVCEEIGVLVPEKWLHNFGR